MKKSVLKKSFLKVKHKQPDPPKPFCDCWICGEIIYYLETVWYYCGSVKCSKCMAPGEAGHWEPAGWTVPGVDEFVG